MVISAAGAIRHDDLVRHARAKFGTLAEGEGEDGAPARFVGGARASKRKFAQTHLLFGFESPSHSDRRFYACQVFSGILGGGMSSRLFQEAREKRGLCYSIYSSAWGLSDGGMFNVHAATSEEQLDALRTVIIDELNRAAGEAPAVLELERAKAGLKAGLLMGLESSSARAEQMARQIIGFDRLFDANELIDNVEAVTAEDVRLFAESIIGSPKPAVAIVGCGRRSMAVWKASRGTR